MADERLRYYIEAIWRGKSDVNAAQRDIEKLGDAGEKSAGSVQDVSKAGTSLGTTFKALAASGAVIAIANQLKNFAIESVNAASDVQEMQSKFDTVFGSSAGSVTQQLDEFAAAANRSTFDLQEFAASVQDTFVPLGFARDRAAELSVQTVKLATDLASFNNLDTADVMRDLQSALVGNTETLRKYGVVANQAAIEQEAINSGLWDGTGAMDAATKALAIYNLTLKSTTDAQGDAIRTADSLANQQRGLEAAVQDLKVAIGQGLLPEASKLTKALTGVVREMADNTKEANLLREAFDAGVITAKEYHTAIAIMSAEQREQSGILEKARAGLEDYNAALEVLNSNTSKQAKTTAQVVEQMTAAIPASNNFADSEYDVSDAATAAELAMLQQKNAAAALAAQQQETEGTIRAYTIAATESIEVTNSLAEAAINSALAHGANAEEITALYVQLGLLTAAEAEQITKQAEASAAAEQLGEAYARGEIQAWQLQQAIVSLNQSLNGFASRPVTIKFKTDLSEWVLPPGVDAGDATVRGGIGVGFAHGTGGWQRVPPGFPNDSYGPVWLSSGELFNVIPANQQQNVTIDMRGSRFGGDTSGITAAVDAALRRVGISAQSRTRI